MAKPAQKSNTYTYRQVEEALAEALGVFPLYSVLPLRARLKVFQHLGFTPEKPGRGKVIRYTITHIYDWALGLALADLGLDPKTIIENIVPGSTIRMLHGIGDEDDHFYMIRPHVLKPDSFVGKGFLAGRGVTAESINRLGGGRASLINIKMLLGAVDEALAKRSTN